MSVFRAEPVPLASRIAAIDVIRGIALFGILVVNMAFFGGTLADAIYDPTLADGPLVDRVVWFVENTFFAGKFISLFSFLFGAGLALQMARLDAARAAAKAEGRKGRSTTWLILRRLAILMAVGLAHGLLLWYGDILFYYALLGWILIPARFLSAKVLAVIAIILATLSFTCMGGFAALQMMKPEAPSAVSADATSEDATNEDATSEDEKDEVPPTTSEFLDQLRAANFDVTRPSLRAEEIRIYREGPLKDVLVIRAVQWGTLIPIMVFVYGMHIVAMFLTGMAAAKCGFFGGNAARPQRRAMLIGLPLGVACTASASVMIWSASFNPGARLYVLAAPLGEIGTFALSLGYAALITRLVHGGAFSPLFAPIACAGRMAFTVYLSETALMTGLMYWWGFGRFATFSRLEHFLIAMATWIVLVAFSTLWLTAFRMGPLEWLWRMGTYLEVPAIRKGAESSSAGGESN